MPAVTYLNAWEERNWTRVPNDEECNNLLQELRIKSGENWLIGTRYIPIRRTFKEWLWRKPVRLHRHYTLYADCHGEYQIINLVTPNGGSVFHGSGQSREDVMNFMLGILCGLHKCQDC